jgi:hypothetical protein
MAQKCYGSRDLGIADRAIINKTNILYPNEVRDILNSNNDEIKRLCLQSKVYPKKDSITGKTFFMKDDVDFLKRIKELHSRGQKLLSNDDRTLRLPAESPKEEKTSVFVNGDSLIKEFQNALAQVILTQESMAEKLQETIENKLDGLDDVVIELIQIKTENENLRVKMNQLTKENYDLRTDLDSFKSIGLGLYTKQKSSIF